MGVGCLWMAWTCEGSCGVVVISARCLLSSAFGDGFIQSEVLLLQKVFDRISVEKAFDDLISDVLLSTVVRAEFAGLGQLPKADQKVVECFSRLLNAAAECPSLYRLVNVTLHVALNGRYYLRHAASLRIGKAKVLDYCHRLTRKTQGKRLHLFSCRLCAEAGEAEVGFPLRLPRLEVRSSVDLQVEFWQVSLTKCVRHDSTGCSLLTVALRCSQRHVSNSSISHTCIFIISHNTQCTVY